MTEIEEIEQGDQETGIRGQAGRLHDYFRHGSPNDFPAFLKALLRVKGGTISRSEAALLLDCSRQRIHQIVREGKVRCWHFHGGFIRDSVIYSELSVLDLLNYAESIGHPVEQFHAMKYVEWRDEVQEYFAKQCEQAKFQIGREYIVTKKESTMPFLTYENRYDPHVTVHKTDCRHPYKHGGNHKYKQGTYRDHSTFAEADAYAQSTGLKIIYCSTCNPQAAS